MLRLYHELVAGLFGLLQSTLRMVHVVDVSIEYFWTCIFLSKTKRQAAYFRSVLGSCYFNESFNEFYVGNFLFYPAACLFPHVP